MAIVLKFLAAHWGKALAGILLVGITWYFTNLIQDNKDMIASLAQRELVVSLKKAEVAFLEERLDNINLKLEQIEDQNNEIRSNIELSSQQIQELEQQRIELLNSIESIELPDNAEAQIDWLRQQAIIYKQNKTGDSTD